MPYSDSHEKMSLVEQHGIQLRQAADSLVYGADLLLGRSVHFLDQAEAMLEEVKRRSPEV